MRRCLFYSCGHAGAKARVESERRAQGRWPASLHLRASQVRRRLHDCRPELAAQPTGRSATRGRAVARARLESTECRPGRRRSGSARGLERVHVGRGQQRTAGRLLSFPVAALKAFQDRLGYAFRDEGLLRLALTHPSVAHEQGASVQHNQRLEFLGDAVLQLVLTTELYEKFPAFGEGPLTKARAKLVNRRTLAEHAWRLGL